MVPPEFLLLGTFLPFVALQHHGSYGGYRRHVGDGAARPSLTDTVEKGFREGSPSNIDSRRASNEQHRFKTPFARIRLFQTFIPQPHFGDFFNAIDPDRTPLEAVRRAMPRQSFLSVGYGIQFADVNCLLPTAIKPRKGARCSSTRTSPRRWRRARVPLFMALRRHRTQ